MSVTLSTGLIHFKDPTSGTYISLDTIQQPVIAGIETQIENTIINETLPILEQELDNYIDNKISVMQGINSLKSGVGGFTSGVFAGGGYDLLVVIPTGIQLARTYTVGADDYQSSSDAKIKRIVPSFEFSPTATNTSARIGNDSQGVIRLYTLNSNNEKIFNTNYLIRIVRIDINEIGMITLRLEIFQSNGTKILWNNSNLDTHNMGNIGTNVFGYFHITLNLEQFDS